MAFDHYHQHAVFPAEAISRRRHFPVPIRVYLIVEGRPTPFIPTSELSSSPSRVSDGSSDSSRSYGFNLQVKRYGNWRSDWKNVGRGIDCRHTLDECPEQEQEQALVVGEVKVLNGIRLLPPARRVPRGDDFTATTFPSSIPGIF